MELYVIGQKKNKIRVYDEGSGDIQDVDLKQLLNPRILSLVRNIKLENQKIVPKEPNTTLKMHSVVHWYNKDIASIEDITKSKEGFTVVSHNEDGLYRCVNTFGKDFWADKAGLDKIKRRLNNYNEDTEILDKVTTLRKESLDGKLVYIGAGEHRKDSTMEEDHTIKANNAVGDIVEDNSKAVDTVEDEGVKAEDAEVDSIEIEVEGDNSISINGTDSYTNEITDAEKVRDVEDTEKPDEVSDTIIEVVDLDDKHIGLGYNAFNDVDIQVEDDTSSNVVRLDTADEDIPEDLIEEIEEVAKNFGKETKEVDIIQISDNEVDAETRVETIDMDSFFDLCDTGEINFTDKKSVRISQKDLFVYQLMNTSVGDIFEIKNAWVKELNIKVKCIVDSNSDSTNYVGIAIMAPEKNDQKNARNIWILVKNEKGAKVQKIQALSRYGYNIEDGETVELYKREYKANRRQMKYLEI